MRDRNSVPYNCAEPQDPRAEPPYNRAEPMDSIPFLCQDYFLKFLPARQAPNIVLYDLLNNQI